MPTLADGSSTDVCDVEISSLPVRTRKPLSLNDWLLVEASVDTVKQTGHVDRIVAYRKVHPNTTYNSAKASAWKKFTNPALIEAIQARLRYEGLTKEAILSVMLETVDRAKSEGKLDTVLAGCMDILKARGELIEKKDVTTHDESKSSPIRQLVEQTLQQTGKG